MLHDVVCFPCFLCVNWRLRLTSMSFIAIIESMGRTSRTIHASSTEYFENNGALEAWSCLTGWVHTLRRSVNAGVDLEMPGPTRWRGNKLLKAVNDGLVSESVVDSSARRVLELASALDRFEHPEEPPESEAVNPNRDAFICNTAAEGMVILKNEGSALPLSPNASVAVIGHLAKVVSLGGGGSAKINSLHGVTPLDGLQNLGIRRTFEPGVPVFGAVPHAEPSIVSRTGDFKQPGEEARPVKLEWFNGSKIGQKSGLYGDDAKCRIYDQRSLATASGRGLLHKNDVRNHPTDHGQSHTFCY
jgi:hypothetical protein